MSMTTGGTTSARRLGGGRREVLVDTVEEDPAVGAHRLERMVVHDGRLARDRDDVVESPDDRSDHAVAAVATTAKPSDGEVGANP